MTQTVALSWLVLGTTGSAIDLSLVAACNFGPSLLLSAWAGALAQHHSRRKILIATQSALLALALLLYGCDIAGVRTLWILLTITTAAGVVTAFDAPSRQLFVLDLVGGKRVASAVSLNEVMINGARVFGPALGGFLLATSGSSVCFLVNAVSFLPTLAVLVIVGNLRRELQPLTPRRRGAIRAGLRYAISQPEIKVCLCLAVALGLIFNASTMLPLMTKDVLHQSGATYGSLLAAFGLGAVPGALLAGRAVKPDGITLRRLVLACAIAVLVTAQSVSLTMMLIGEAVIGFLSIWTVALANTMVQLRSKPEMRGRVLGLWVMLLPGAYPLTGVLAGFVAQDFSARAAFSLAALALGATLLIGWQGLAQVRGGTIAAAKPSAGQLSRCS